MKKLFLMCALSLLGLSVMANPAIPKPASLRGPVKGQLDVRLHGDEKSKYCMLTDCLL